MCSRIEATAVAQDLAVDLRWASSRTPFDHEATALPVQLDGLTPSRPQISTWATEAGYLDVLVDLVDRQGHRQRYEDLEAAAEELTVAGVKVRVAGLEDIIASKENADRPKDHEALPSCTGSVTA